LPGLDGDCQRWLNNWRAGAQGGRKPPGELLVFHEVEPGERLLAAYREFKDDGFVITAFLTRRKAALERRKQLWP
ncbi:MAG TPA: hypothetical protein VKU44_08010, partial [Terriglobia bacterium]|nr:hypothetical protein [Terriglobia bacterium]